MSAFKQTASVAAKGLVQRFLAGQVPPGFVAVGESTALPTGGLLATSVANGTGSGYGAAVYVSVGAGQGLWRVRNNALQYFDVVKNEAGQSYTVPNTRSGTLESE